ncbi:putative type II site-specific deoxyribonuclease [Burkholderia pseudomallei MSHR7527]|uniref:restriction endonuclease n=1 Tax=Burkholderia pseudomallei TaxID=28450 RepID=UPI000531476F|nr:restriction endonuclease [Burkholderia pseudomallei]KGS65880.1 putative type II site-specific deoxyribonuclease [Burkholderia pseudomallei MSHR7527]
MDHTTKQRILDWATALTALTSSQQEWVQAVISQFQLDFRFTRDAGSDLITDAVLANLGDALRIHHAFSRQALSKDRFEFALERALNRAGKPAQLVKSRTNPGHDITIENFRASLKTEAASGIKPHQLHISKFMELGKGEWQLELLREAFLSHLSNYDRIFSFRCLVQGPSRYFYELVEIPKNLLLEGAHSRLQIMETSRQTPKPGYGYVDDEYGNRKYALYFDGGTERKLQIKGIRKDLCFVHATWDFYSLSLEGPLNAQDESCLPLN